MSKFHINSKGNPGRCSAQKDNCPFGGSDEHFAIASEARHSYEAKAALDEPNLLKGLLPLVSASTLTGRYAARDPETTAEELAVILTDNPDVEVRKSIAAHGNVSAESLDVLSKDSSPHVRGIVAANGNAHPITLKNMVDALPEKGAMYQFSIAESLASNPSTPVESLNKILGDRWDETNSSNVGVDESSDSAANYAAAAVAANPSTPMELVEELTSDPSLRVRQTALLALETRDHSWEDSSEWGLVDSPKVGRFISDARWMVKDRANSRKEFRTLRSCELNHVENWVFAQTELKRRGLSKSGLSLEDFQGYHKMIVVEKVRRGFKD